MQIHLEKSKCSGHAQCYATSPELFPIDDLGYSTIEVQPVPAGDEQVARQGVAACPEMALFLAEDISRPTA